MSDTYRHFTRANGGLGAESDLRWSAHWTDAGDTIAAVSGGGQIVIVNVTDGVRVGTADLATAAGEWLYGLAYLDGKLYFNIGGIGIYALVLTGVDLQSAHGDLTPSRAVAHYGYTRVVGVGSLGDPQPTFANNNNFANLAVWNDASGHLRLATRTPAGLEIFDATAATRAYSGKFALSSATYMQDRVAYVGGALYWTTENFVHRLDAPESAANDFLPTATVAGTFNDDFSVAGRLTGWSTSGGFPRNDAIGTTAVSGGALWLSVTATSSDWVYRLVERRGLFALPGSLEIELACPTWGTNQTNEVDLYFGAAQKRLYVQWYYNQWRCSYDGSALTSVSGAATLLRLRFAYSDPTLTIQYKANGAANWTTLQTYTNAGLEGFSLYVDTHTRVAPYVATLAINEVVADYAAGAYNGPPLARATDLAVVAGGEQPVIAVGGASGGWVVRADQSEPRVSDKNGTYFGPYTVDGDVDVLWGTSNAVATVALTADAVPDEGGLLAVGTPGGLTLVDLANHSRRFALDEVADEPVVSDTISFVRSDGAGGWLVGSTASATALGGLAYVAPQATKTAPIQGFAYDRGYGERPDAAWAESLIPRGVGGAARDVVAWATESGGTMLAMATDWGVVAIERDGNRRVGFATRRGGYACLADDADYLYLGTTDAGVWRVAKTDLDGVFTGAVELVADVAAGLVADDIVDIAATSVEDETALVICQRIADASDAHYPYAASLWRAGAAKHAAAGFWLRRAWIDGDGAYLLSGANLHRVDDLSAVVEGWLPDTTVAGRLGDAFGDATPVDWTRRITGSPTTATVAEADNALVLALTPTGASDAVAAARSFRVPDDADVWVKWNINGFPAVTSAGQSAAAGLVLTWPDGASIAAERRRYHDGTLHDVLRATDGTNATAVDVTGAIGWLRLRRDGATVTAYGRIGSTIGDWTELRTFTVSAATAELSVRLASNVTSGGGASFAALTTAYNNGGGPFDLRDTAAAGGDVTANALAIAYGDAAFVLTRGESATIAHTLAPLGATIGAVALAADAGRALVGTTDDGLWAYDLATGAVITHHTATSGQPSLGEAIATVARGGSFVYASDDGVGWIEPDATAPADTALIVEEEGMVTVLAWDAPADVDWSHSLVYRRKNGGTWAALQDDLTWGGASPLAFAAELSFADDSLVAPDDYGRYDYRVTQVDEAGNESAGATRTVYKDEPRVAAVVIAAGASQVGYNGVGVAVIGESGAASGETVDAVGAVRLRQAGYAWNPWQAYESGGTYYTALVATPYGVKTVEAQVRSAGGILGGTGSDTILTVAPTAIDEGPGRNEFWLAAGPFVSDLVATMNFTRYNATSGLTVNDDDADFPPANARDVRLAVKAQSSHRPDENDTIYFTANLGAASYNPRYVMIGGHNLGLFAALRVELEMYYIAAGWATWDITNLVAAPLVVVDLRAAEDTPNLVSAVRLKLTHTGGALYPAGNPSAIALGRFAVVGAADCVQPTSDNLQRDWTLAYETTGVVTHTAGARYAVNPGRVRRLSGSLGYYSEADREALLRHYETNLAHTPVLALLYPERVPRLRDGSPVVDAYAGRVHAYYAWWDSPPRFVHAANDYATGRVELLEVLADE